MDVETLIKLDKVFEEIIGTLCYSANIPHHHKLDMLRALEDFRKQSGIELEPANNPEA